MINESQIRQHIASFLAGKESLADFEDWLARNSWNMHKDSEQNAQDLVSDIELRLSEFSSGHLSEDELKQELASLANEIKMSRRLGVSSPVIKTAASAITYVIYAPVTHVGR